MAQEDIHLNIGYCLVLLQKGKKGMAACDSKPEVVTQTSLSNLTFRCNFCHVQMYVQPIFNSMFTNTPLCQHIYAKQIPSQKSSHHETLNLITTVVCNSSYLCQAQPKRETSENPSIIPQNSVFLHKPLTMADDSVPPPVDPNQDVEEAEPAGDEEEIEDVFATQKCMEKWRGFFLKLNRIPMNRISLPLLQFPRLLGRLPTELTFFLGFVKNDDQP